MLFTRSLSLIISSTFVPRCWCALSFTIIIAVLLCILCCLCAVVDSLEIGSIRLIEIFPCCRFAFTVVKWFAQVKDVANTTGDLAWQQKPWIFRSWSTLELINSSINLSVPAKSLLKTTLFKSLLIGAGILSARQFYVNAFVDYCSSSGR